MKINKRGVTEGMVWFLIVVILGVIFLVYAVGPKGLFAQTRDTANTINEQIRIPMLAQFKNTDFSKLSPEQQAQLGNAEKKSLLINDAERLYLQAMEQANDADKKSFLQKALAKIAEAQAISSNNEIINARLAQVAGKIKAAAESMQFEQAVADAAKAAEDKNDFRPLEDLVKSPNTSPLQKIIAEKEIFILRYQSSSPEEQNAATRKIWDDAAKAYAQKNDGWEYRYLLIAFIFYDAPWVFNNKREIVYATNQILSLSRKEQGVDDVAVAHAYLLHGNALFKGAAVSEDGKAQLKDSMLAYHFLYTDSKMKAQLDQLYPDYYQEMAANLKTDKAIGLLPALDIEVYLNGELRDADDGNSKIEFKGVSAGDEAVSLLHKMDYANYRRYSKLISFIIRTKDYADQATKGEVDGLRKGKKLYFTIIVSNPYTKEIICYVQEPSSPIEGRQQDKLLSFDYEKFTSADNLVGRCGNYFSLWSYDADATYSDNDDEVVRVSFASAHLNNPMFLTN